MSYPTADAQYAGLLCALLERGGAVRTRNSDVRRLFAWTCCFDRAPLLTARKAAWKNALREWEFFMSGKSNLEDMHPSVRPWWRPWAEEDGHIYYHYGQQFRNFVGAAGTVDQIELLLDGIKNHPFSRRNVITTWNTADMHHALCRLTTCHGTVVQAFVEPDNSLHLVTYQRSADAVCGLPHNWIQYWAFLLWLAHCSGRGVGTLTWVGGDVHLYECHFDLARKILAQDGAAEVPQLVYAPTSEEFLADDFTLDRQYRFAFAERAEMVV